MSTGFASNNRCVQMGVIHRNIYTCTEPRSASHSQDTLVSDSENPIDAAATLALAQAPNRAQRCLDMVQDKTSEHTQIVGVAERLDSILLDIKDLNPEQWGSLENGVILSFHSCTAASWNVMSSNLLCWQSCL
ncbi:hypothetical protein HAV15_012186 [Penicillium sp. str. |nr:hypothetical protein HAV15_012186 [Penicillium sp. str. \